MNEIQEIYCRGAAMAYRDAAEIVRRMIQRAPEELKDLLFCLEPLAAAYEKKAMIVYAECELFNVSLNNSKGAN